MHDRGVSSPDRHDLSMATQLAFFAALLLASGLCALVYQTVWVRSFRHVFGGGTPAAAAVLAVFMGGLGWGAYRLGRSVDASRRPLRLYALLELGIAVSAALSPLLLGFVRWIYFSTGGTGTLGSVGATLLRLLLTPLVIGVPVFLMGGTLPAISRAATKSYDAGRRALALLYGANAIGAVVGVCIPTFWSFEHLGVRTTLWAASALNLVVAALAAAASARQVDAVASSKEPSPAADEPQPPCCTPASVPEPRVELRTRAAIPRRWLLAAAFVTGFCFLLAELVWFRMTAPLLGGTTFSFGVVLAVALLGLGIGAVAFSVVGRPVAAHFALCSALEALLLVLPYALGDDLAKLAAHLRVMAAGGFPMLVCGWTVIASVMVLPAATVAGYQFPLLLSLAGRADERVSVDVGDLYAANTAGAITGSLLGGFVLLPLLTAVGAWKLAAAMLLPVAYGFSRRNRAALVGVGIVAAATVLSCMAPGPSTVWRHGAVGAGRSQIAKQRTWNERVFYEYDDKRRLFAEYEGREVSLAIELGNGFAFIVDGKSDGSLIMDATTTVFLSLTGAALHPRPERAFVVGLGGGQTAGWLAQVPTMKQVDVAEIEPKVLEFARLGRDYNFNVLEHPRVDVRIGDAREMLQTRAEDYDLIVSEPSNVYRAGIASLYTSEFYEHARRRLRSGGIFGQWLQAYDLDPETLRLCIATLRGAFPYVTVWVVGEGDDLLLLASKEPMSIDIGRVRERLGQEPYQSAYQRIGGIYDIEGFLAQFVADDGLASRALQLAADGLNTDDRTLLEYQAARSVGRIESAPISVHLRALAEELGMATPPIHNGRYSSKRMAALRTRVYQRWTTGGRLPRWGTSHDQQTLFDFWQAMQGERYVQARALLTKLDPPLPHDHFERLLRAHAVARDPRAPLSERLEQELSTLELAGRQTDVAWLRVHAAAVRPHLHAALPGLMEEACRLARSDPLTDYARLRQTLVSVSENVRDPKLARELTTLILEGPFAIHMADRARRMVGMRLAAVSNDFTLMVKAFHGLEPYPVWHEEALAARVEAYRATGDPLLSKAEADFELYRAHKDVTLKSVFGDPLAQASR